MMTGVGYLAILAVTILGIQVLGSGINRIVGILLLVIFTVLFALLPRSEKTAWMMHVHLGVMTVIVAVLIALKPDAGIFPMLFFVLSPTAMMAFPTRTGLIWILAFTLVTGIVFLSVAPPLEALMALLLYFAGYWFFGAFARALVSAEDARSESQRLLAELQEAHLQLQDYAARVEELAVAEERNRLSREMHDTIGHRLTVAAVQLEGAQRLIVNDPNRAARMVDTVRQQVRGALAELRHTVATLREPLEADLSLNSGLHRLVNYFREATDLTIQLELPEETSRLPQAHQLALYRAAQEALTNIQKHAGAENVWISLRIAADQIILTVSDDGKGFPDALDETAFGLRGMRERAAHLGGALHPGASPEGGAQLQVRLPLPEEEINA
jgi:signal transduction histidine kinase